MPATSDDREPGGDGNRPTDSDLQSVSRDLHAAVSNSPRLISLHLKNYTNNPAAIKRPSILCAYRTKSPVPRVWPHPKRVISLSPDLQPTNRDGELASRVICSAGEIGVLLLGNETMSNPDFCLWNPATRLIRQLPDPYDYCVIANKAEIFNTYGVGFDPVSNDIKVVLLHSSHWDPPSSQVLVYTLGSGCWKELEGVDGRYSIGSLTCHATYFSGSLYWICGSSEVSVVAFDLGTDSFSMISCDFIHPFGYRRNEGLFIYRDSIALFGWDRDLSVGVWLLSSTGFGSGSSWIKHSTLPPWVGSLHPLVCLNENQFVGYCRKDPPTTFAYHSNAEADYLLQLVLVDISGGAQVTVEVLRLIPSCLGIYGCFSYKETLVSLA
ncbi:unnamed protein product [Linum trigynum]|uniref:F-box associated beta-propeller type 3 domain-containing protein n=1 Tax=Linum trigynum TaxID=586398 RepID=A0AAV2DGE1_9ROSI